MIVPLDLGVKQLVHQRQHALERHGEELIRAEQRVEAIDVTVVVGIQIVAEEFRDWATACLRRVGSREAERAAARLRTAGLPE